MVVIEWLKFRVDPQLREKFIQLDREIWTKSLSQSEGFLGKEIWLDPNFLEEVILIIYWESREQWQAISPEELQRTEKAFDKKMGRETYELLEAKEFQIRQFLQR